MVVSSKVSRSFRSVLLCLIAFGYVLFANSATAAEPRWRKVETEYFTIYSQGNSKETRQWAIKLEQFRFSMEALFPLEGRQLERVTMFIFRKQKEFNRYNPLLRDNPDSILGVFQRGRGRNTIAMAMNSDDDDMANIVFHEATHWYFSSLGYELPIWVSEGLAEVFAQFRIEGGQSVFGGGNTERYRMLEYYGFYFVRNVMNAPRGAVHGASDKRAALYYAHALILMNYLMTDGDLGGFEALKRYLALTRSEVPYDVAFQEVFRMTYDELDAKLDKYFKRQFFSSIRIPMNFPAELVKGKEVWATEDEVDVALALFLLQQYRREEAKEIIDRILVRSPESSYAYEALADLAALEGDFSQRDDHYAKAAELGSTNPLVYFYAYRSRVNSYRFQEAAAIQADQDILKKAMESLYRAIELRPTLARAYELMAELMGSLDKPTKKDYQMMKLGAQRYPDKPVFEVAMASYEMKHRKPKTAKRRLDKVLGEDRDFYTTRYAKKILMRLKAQVDLYWMRKAFEERDTSKLYKFGEALARAPLISEERVEVNAMKQKLNQLLYIERAQKAMDENEWGMAEVLLEEVDVEQISEEMAEPYEAAQERLRKHRQG